MLFKPASLSDWNSFMPRSLWRAGDNHYDDDDHHLSQAPSPPKPKWRYPYKGT